MLNKALKLAAQYHKGTDKQGVPYILHPLSVMASVDRGLAKVVAVLHDLVEDTDVTLNMLRHGGFPESVVKAVDCLTHREGEPYCDYILRCSNNSLATQVKVADLEHNFNLPRTFFRIDRMSTDILRIKKYLLSWQFLNDRICWVDYVRAMKVEVYVKEK